MFNRRIDFESLESTLGHTFNDIKWLREALTRPSAINENVQFVAQKSFQRLEFLGDRVLNLVVAELILHYFPDLPEGQLGTLHTMQISNESLVKIAKAWRVNNYLITGNNENINNTKAQADAVEAIVGAIYIDSDRNYQKVRTIIDSHWKTIKTNHYFGFQQTQTKPIVTQEPTVLPTTYLQGNVSAGHIFKNDMLLRQALTTQSAVQEKTLLAANKSLRRFEFLGNRVINLCLSDYLFEENKNFNPSQLTNALSLYISKEVLSNISSKLQLGIYLITGRGEKSTCTKDPKILADALKALLAAIFLDSNFDVALIKGIVIQQWELQNRTNLTQTL